MLTRLQYHTFRPFRGLPLKGVGIEIGTYRGDFAKVLLKKRGITKLFCIDPYNYDGDSQAENSNKAKSVAIRKLSKFNMKFIFMPSSFAVEKITEKVDFVYIDGDHTYKYVKEDIDNYWSLVKPGGYFGGHDFHYTWPGVIKAVTEFSVNNNLILNVESPDWWICKPLSGIKN